MIHTLPNLLRVTPTTRLIKQLAVAAYIRSNGARPVCQAVGEVETPVVCVGVGAPVALAEEVVVGAVVDAWACVGAGGVAVWC